MRVDTAYAVASSSAEQAIAEVKSETKYRLESVSHNIVKKEKLDSGKTLYIIHRVDKLE